ncbi:MAG: pepsin/retropepsin-like aspartic protease family protein [Chitinophagales bacterium]
MSTLRQHRNFFIFQRLIAAAGVISFTLFPFITIATEIPLDGQTFTSLQVISNPEGDFEVLVVPLKRAQNLLLVEATVDSISGNFILDTGAPYLVLNKTYFRKGKEKEGARANGVTGGVSAVSHTVIDRLDIQKLFYKSIQADLVNLGHIEDSKGVKILGLLGASLFNELEMEIDIDKNVMYLYKLNKLGERISSAAQAAAIQADLQIPLEIESNIIFLNATVGGSKLRYCLDTGAEINVLSNEVSKKVLQHFSLTSRNVLTGTSNQRVEVFGGELDELTIGNQTFENEQTILTGLAGLKSVYNTNLDGILGYNFLAKGRVIINYRKKQLTMYFYNTEQK